MLCMSFDERVIEFILKHKKHPCTMSVEGLVSSLNCSPEEASTLLKNGLPLTVKDLVQLTEEFNSNQPFTARSLEYLSAAQKSSARQSTVLDALKILEAEGLAAIHIHGSSGRGKAAQYVRVAPEDVIEPPVSPSKQNTAVRYKRILRAVQQENTIEILNELGIPGIQSVIKTLYKKGWVSLRRERVGKKNRNYYKITTLGESVLDQLKKGDYRDV